MSLHGFVGNMHEFMGASDVMVTKAGPGTIAEAAIKGLPVMLNNYLPGREAGNVRFVTRDAQFGHFAKRPRRIAATISGWLREETLPRGAPALRTIGSGAGNGGGGSGVGVGVEGEPPSTPNDDDDDDDDDDGGGGGGVTKLGQMRANALAAARPQAARHIAADLAAPRGVPGADTPARTGQPPRRPRQAGPRSSAPCRPPPPPRWPRRSRRPHWRGACGHRRRRRRRRGSGGLGLGLGLGGGGGWGARLCGAGPGSR